MTTRDSKGRFTKPCKVKKAKVAVREWWKENGEGIICCLYVVAIFVAIVIACVWLFGDKVTSTCKPMQQHRANGTEKVTDSNGDSWYQLKWEEYTNECAYFTETHSHYTVAESIKVVCDGTVAIIKNIIGWVTSHPVI